MDVFPLRRGIGWRTGGESLVQFSRAEGPVTIEWRGERFPLESGTYVAKDRAAELRWRGHSLLGVEHLFSALSGLGIREGVVIAIEGDELPLLDGGARSFCEAFLELGFELAGSSMPTHEIVREGELSVAESHYRFEPSATVRVEVALEGLPPCVSPTASWDGSPRSFFERIAPARTFALERELDALIANGMRPHVEPQSVIIVGTDRLFGAGVVSADEPARHKLLDWIGDATTFGGPPRGKVRALRPGHARNIEAMRRALAEGWIVPSTSTPRNQ